MRRISMAARDELVAAIVGRYAQGDRSERGRILDEFTAVTGFHRKHAMRLLRAGPVSGRGGLRPGRRVYDDAVREVLIAPLLVREQRLLTEVLSELRKLLPFPLLGLDTDNDSVFMNETVRDFASRSASS